MRALGLAVFLALVAACKGKPRGTAKRAVAFANDESAQAIVDDDYRFKLGWPGDGWRTLREKDAAQIMPHALAGVLSDKGVFGAVLIDQAPGMTVDQFGKLRLDNLRLQDKRVLRAGLESRAGEHSYRFLVRGKVNDTEHLFDVTAFVRDDWAYQVVAWTRAPANDETLEQTVKRLEPVAAAFTLTSGPIRARRATATTGSQTGVTWRIESGVFESALTRVRLRPPDGWRIATLDEIAQLDADAEMGLVRNDPDVSLALVAEHVPSARRADVAAERTRELRSNVGAEEPLGQHETLVLGVKRKLERYRDARGFELVHTAFATNDGVMELLARHPAIASEKSLAELDRVLAALERLDDDRARALTAELESAPDKQNAVGPDWALRRGVFRDFGHRWRWRKPPRGVWRLRVGDAAKSVAPSARLYFIEPARGIHGTIAAESAAGMVAPVHHKKALARLERDVGFRADGEPAKGMKLGGEPAWVTRGEATRPMKLGYLAASTMHGNTALALTLWGHPDDLRAEESLVTEALSSLAFDDLAATVVTDGTVRDWRFGYTLALDEWTALPSPAAPNAASVAAWKKGSHQVTVAAICVLDDRAQEHWIQGFVDQRVRAELGQVMDTKPEEKTVVLGGLPAKRVSYTSLMSHADVYYVTRDRTLFAILSTGSKIGALDVPKAWRFLD